MKLQFKALVDGATLPSRSSKYAVGYDLYAVNQAKIPGTSTEGKPNWDLIETGLQVAIPEGHYGRIAPRSGLAMKGIDVLAGVIDPDYRGEVKVILINHGFNDFRVDPGIRIAQLIIEKVATPETEFVDELPETVRGDKGFGSSGK